MKIDSHRIAREEVLSELYGAFSKGEPEMGIKDLCSRVEKTANEVFELLLDLHQDGFAVVVTNESYKILPQGALYAERNRLAPESMVLENKTIRAGILNELAQFHERAGVSQSIPVQTIARGIAKNVEVVWNNVGVLTDLGLIVPDLAESFRITESGLLEVKNRKSPPQTH
jgi:hypothetical protein